MAKPKPPFYLLLQKQYPDFFRSLESLGEAARNAGPLDAKTVHLVQLAAAATSRSEGAVHSHTRRAIEAGATPDEVRRSAGRKMSSAAARRRRNQPVSARSLTFMDPAATVTWKTSRAR
jgi:AhpD family alkylhydroperoxidase